MNKDIVVVVLAGGVGKRFWPISTYKSIFPFFNKPLLQHNLEMLGASGFRHVIIVANSGDRDQIMQIKIPNMSITVVVQPDAQGMGDALLTTKKLVEKRPLLVMNAEDVVDQHLYDNLAKHTKEEKVFVVGKKVADYLDVGYLKLDGERLMEIVEKPGKGNEPSNLVNLVFDYFPDPSIFFDALVTTKSEKDDVYERALSKIFAQTNARVIDYDGFWQPFKYPWHVLDVMEYFLNNKCTAHRGKNVEIKSNVVIEGAVYIEDNVRIFENTKIVGPCYIGKDTIIGNNNIIRHSHIGNGCVTGFNTDITRSYIGDACWFHSNYIGDSVLEGNVSMGSGSVLANLRLDEGDIFSIMKGDRMNTKRNKLGVIIGRDVRIGVNTSIMPGIKIGAHSFVGAGIVVDKDIPGDSFCMAQSVYTVTPNNRTLSSKGRDEFKKRL